jgi:hypothetical protein
MLEGSKVMFFHRRKSHDKVWLCRGNVIFGVQRRLFVIGIMVC